MPIVVKDFSWKQTENTITISVPLKGVHHSKVDIFHSDRLIKANYEKFFFEVLLTHPINANESKCTLTSKEIVFELTKIEKLQWETLEPDLSKKEKMEQKLQLINEEFQRIQAKNEEKETKKAELKRLAVSEQMKIESGIRNRIEDIKKKEKEEALGDVEQWKTSLTAKIQRKKKKKFEKYLAKRPSEIPVPDLDDMEEIEIPKPRAKGEIQVDFTPRVFPTPMRESKTEEENEWLRKQAEARRTVGFISEDIRPEEKNPQFLLKKGDEFMKNNNFLGAISAYSFGIKLSEKFVDLYVARSRAQYAQGNYQRCTMDCSTALELMVPKVPANLAQRAECIGRRGMALCKIKMLSKGISELEASLELCPNKEYKEFLDEAEKEWMNKSDSE